jgi:hypothetical protein
MEMCEKVEEVRSKGARSKMDVRSKVDAQSNAEINSASYNSTSVDASVDVLWLCLKSMSV